jgi:prepilin-type N-terminal cleavage/methylation domain-containing protein
MISLKKRNQGFTIVELLIVIVVIGILALLVITTYSGIQAKARNSKRASDIATIQTQLEAFFQNKGYYPSLADMNQTSSSTWLKDNMKSLDPTALSDPSDTSNQKLANTTDPSKKYGYVVTTSDDQSCESDDTTCAKYTLTAKYEGTYNGATQIQKNNLD